MNITFRNLISKTFYVELEQKRNLNFFLIYQKNLFCNLKRKLKLETFDHGTFLHQVHELLLTTLHVRLFRCRLRP